MNIKKYINQYKNLPKNIYVLFICMIVYGSGNFIYPIITIILNKSLGYEAETVGFLMSVSIILQFPFLLLGGKIADVCGKRKILIIFYLFGSISYFICALISISVIKTVLLIFISSLISILTPIMNALIAEYTTENNRKEAFSFIYLAANVGAVIGPLLAGQLFEKYIVFLFLGNAIVMLICSFIVLLILKDKSIKTFIEKDLNDTEIEKITKEKNDIKSNVLMILLRDPLLILIVFAMFIFQFANVQWGYLLPLQLIDIFNDKGASYFGIVAGVGGLTLILMTPILTDLLKKINPIKVIALGGIFFVIGYLIFSGSHNVPLFVIGIMCVSMGEVLIYPNYNVIVANRTEEEYRGRILTILTIVTGAGYAFGPIVMGKLSYLSYSIRWWGISLVILIMSILLITYKRDKKVC